MVVSLTLTLRYFLRVFCHFWKLSGCFLFFLQLHCYSFLGKGQLIPLIFAQSILMWQQLFCLEAGVISVLGSTHLCFREVQFGLLKKRFLHLICCPCKGKILIHSSVEFWENEAYLTLFSKSPMWTSISMK